MPRFIKGPATKVRWKYRAGELLAGIAIGGMVALAQHFLVPQSLGIVAGAFIGLLVGMGAQMMGSVFLGIFLGSIEVLVPGMFVGMLGLMLPVIQLPDLQTEIYLGGGIGFLVFFVFGMWDEWIQRTTRSIGPRNESKRKYRASVGWDGPPWLYDMLEEGGVRRRAHFQRQLFRAMKGRILFVAAGTGLNFPYLPPGKDIVAFDLSPRMLKAAQVRAANYEGSISLWEANVQQLPFADESFDTVATASTFCSVADPIQGLRELYRVLKPGGRLLMFEHVRSRNPLLGLELDVLTMVSRYVGPEMNRNTVDNAQRAGFIIDRAVCAYLDIFLAIEGHKRALAAGVPIGRS
jgi:SAM-dependent methyltransferase